MPVVLFRELQCLRGYIKAYYVSLNSIKIKCAYRGAVPAPDIQNTPYLCQVLIHPVERKAGPQRAHPIGALTPFSVPEFRRLICSKFIDSFLLCYAHINASFMRKI